MIRVFLSRESIPSESLGSTAVRSVGKQDNCQAAVSLSVSTWSASLPIAWRLYLPEVWCQDSERCRKAGVPESVEFQTKPEIALQQIRQALEQKVPIGVVLADAGYGKGTQFRTELTQLGLQTVRTANRRHSRARREATAGSIPHEPKLHPQGTTGEVCFAHSRREWTRRSFGKR